MGGERGRLPGVKGENIQMQKLAREQGRNIQVESYALAHARASAMDRG